jgi:hypothetical protein
MFFLIVNNRVPEGRVQQGKRCIKYSGIRPSEPPFWLWQRKTGEQALRKNITTLADRPAGAEKQEGPAYAGPSC